MRVLFAILFSALLALAGWVAPVEAAPDKAASPCAKCCCPAKDCCATAPAPGPVRPPVAPATSISHKQSQPARLAPIVAAAPILSQTVRCSFSSHVDFKLDSVPLFRRNCSCLV